jgi:hypothetical protein
MISSEISELSVGEHPFGEQNGCTGQQSGKHTGMKTIRMRKWHCAPEDIAGAIAGPVRLGGGIAQQALPIMFNDLGETTGSRGAEAKDMCVRRSGCPRSEDRLNSLQLPRGRLFVNQEQTVSSDAFPQNLLDGANRAAKREHTTEAISLDRGAEKFC